MESRQWWLAVTSVRHYILCLAWIPVPCQDVALGLTDALKIAVSLQSTQCRGHPPGREKKHSVTSAQNPALLQHQGSKRSSLPCQRDDASSGQSALPVRGIPTCRYPYVARISSSRPSLMSASSHSGSTRAVSAA